MQRYFESLLQIYLMWVHQNRNLWTLSHSSFSGPQTLKGEPKIPDPRVSEYCWSITELDYSGSPTWCLWDASIQPFHKCLGWGVTAHDLLRVFVVTQGFVWDSVHQFPFLHWFFPCFLGRMDSVSFLPLCYLSKGRGFSILQCCCTVVLPSALQNPDSTAEKY